jgi:hypothetical protein
MEKKDPCRWPLTGGLKQSEVGGESNSWEYQATDSTSFRCIYKSGLTSWFIWVK